MLLLCKLLLLYVLVKSNISKQILWHSRQLKVSIYEKIKYMNMNKYSLFHMTCWFLCVCVCVI